MSRLIIVLCLLFPAFVQAQETEADSAAGADEVETDEEAADTRGVRSLSGDATLGFQSSSGNSETKNTYAELQMKLEWNDWRHSLDGRARKTEDGGETSVERYRASLKSDYNFTEYNYFFATLDYERDPVSGLRRRTSETVGYGRRLAKTGRIEVDAEVGFGFRQIRREQALPDAERREDDAILRGAFQLLWNISEGKRFEQQLVIEEGSSNTYVESVSAFNSNLVGNLYSRLSYTVQHNSTVAPGTENTDYYTTVSLGYKF